MLDTTTKNLIDEARNILVGKIPSPQAQVEQITIALIYKFMDDMDQESIGMGGKVSFFKDEFEKYAWNKIFDPRLGGFEMLALYADAITRMSQNPHLPQLFRNIFKNAFLPYRDPETLRLFLKTINEFHYDHSENLGNAFEYLLSILGSQGDAGQFRTPRHIIDFMVRVVKPEKHERVLDPACGTAGFLIAAYKQIMRSNTRETQGDLLSYAERKALPDNFMGYDISPDMVRLSLVNLYLHGFVQPQIYEYDTLSSEERWEDYADVILANPPFMSPKGGIRPHKHFSVQSNRSEVLFVDYMAEHLTPTGRAAIIVPEGIIFQSGTAYKQLRKYLVESGYLWAVVSLPAGVFNPYAGVKTSILFLDRSLAKKSGQILFVKVAADGFDLGAQRRPVEANDLPAAQKMLEDWQASLGAGATGHVPGATGAEPTPGPSLKGGEVSGQMGLAVEKTRLAEDGEYNLSAERYREVAKARIHQFPYVALDEIFSEIRNGKNVEQIDRVGKYRVSRIQSISYWTFDINKTKWTNDTVNDSDFLQDGDILLSHINSIEHLAKSALISNLNEKIVHGINLIKLRPIKEKIIPMYAHLCLISDPFLSKARSFAQKAVNQASIKVSDIKSIKIPVPPVEVQREIVAEVEGYQRVIDGARAVVENWRPNVEMELEEARRAAGMAAWEVVKLGEVCEVNSESVNPLELFGETEFTYVDISSVENRTGIVNYNNLLKTSEAPSRARRIARHGDVLLSTVRPNLKAFALVSKPPDKLIASTGFAVLRCKKRIIPEYLLISVFSDYCVNQMIQNMGKGSYPSINQTDVENIKLPLPPLEVQREMVERIEAERAVVEANRKLMAIYEAKIRRAVERVWEG